MRSNQPSGNRNQRAAAYGHARTAQGPQAPLQRQIDQAVIQRAAAMHQLGDNLVEGYRGLNQFGGINVVENDAQRVSTVDVVGNPHFSRNVGHINITDEMRPSVPNVAHSEPILIGRAYGAAQANPNWVQANGRVDHHNQQPAGRQNFNLYSERHPCGYAPNNCNGNLQNARFTNNDHVFWSYNGNADANTQAIAADHIGRAQDDGRWDDYQFANHPNDVWKIRGVKVEKKEAKKKPEVIDLTADDSQSQSQSQSQQGSVSAFAKPGLIGSGTFGDPILID